MIVVISVSKQKNVQDNIFKSCHSLCPLLVLIPESIISYKYSYIQKCDLSNPGKITGKSKLCSLPT